MLSMKHLKNSPRYVIKQQPLIIKKYEGLRLNTGIRLPPNVIWHWQYARWKLMLCFTMLCSLAMVSWADKGSWQLYKIRQWRLLCENIDAVVICFSSGLHSISKEDHVPHFQFHSQLMIQFPPGKGREMYDVFSQLTYFLFRTGNRFKEDHDWGFRVYCFLFLSLIPRYLFNLKVLVLHFEVS